MESRGADMSKRAKSRPAIARRSCDQCRSRKIGCDRGSPCSNCTTARLGCTHSAVASHSTPPKQRVLISAQYEQKIDDIARNVDGIKLLLEGINLNSEEKLPVARSTWAPNLTQSTETAIEHHAFSDPGGGSLWDHSSQIVDFVKAVLEDGGSREVGPEASEVLTSLRKLVYALDNPGSTRSLSVLRPEPTKQHANPTMPPLEAAVAVLRWAKDHRGFTRIAWLSQILPLEHFTEICQKVYFAVDGYSDAEFILANGYLSYIFSEHVVVSGLQDYRVHCQLCRKNLDATLSRLPLLLPASMEVIAALTLGAFNAVENSQATLAWRFVSMASELCQTLGYHRARPRHDTSPAVPAKQRLFWCVYGIEKGLSLRLGRASTIRDAEITLARTADEPRAVKLGRINGLVYEQLYSPTGLGRTEDERTRAAESLASDLRVLINDTQAEISDALASDEPDPMRATYLQCDLVCQSSLLALILRAMPAPHGVPDACVVVARVALDMHETCMRSLRGCRNDPFMVAKYINWAILYCPFVPFSILFARAVQLPDASDLARLERFAASLPPAEDPAAALTHPHRLYGLLCRATRLYYDVEVLAGPVDAGVVRDMAGFWAEWDGATAAAAVEGWPLVQQEQGQVQGMYDWCYDSQQMMGLLSEEAWL